MEHDSREKSYPGSGDIVIRELLKRLFTSCPRYLRQMGYLDEQIAIDARLGRNQAAWAPHIAATRKAIIEIARLSSQKRVAVILGAGLLNDVPLVELSAMFETVILADVLHPPWSRRRARRIASNIRCIEFDCTGALAELWRRGTAISDKEALMLFSESAPPPQPENGPCDFTASVNLASQLGYLPSEWLCSERPRPPEFANRLRLAAASRHIAWLRSQPGNSCMVADRALVVRDLAGQEIEREIFLDETNLGPPRSAWIWHLAPIPEWRRDQSIENEVGVWAFCRR